MISSVEDIKKLGSILSVWAHPDDESFSCAGIMAAAIANGQKVVCVTATKGEAGVQDETRWPAARLGDIRTQELEQACSVLGVTDHHWLGYGDGHCHEVPENEAVEQIKNLISRYQPDTILTFGPDGMTGHLDHQSVSRWVELAAKGTDICVYHAVENEEAYEQYLKELDREFNIYFNIDMPPVRSAKSCDIAFTLTPELVNKKYTALKCMPSQTEGLLKALSQDEIGNMFGCECFVCC